MNGRKIETLLTMGVLIVCMRNLGKVAIYQKEPHPIMHPK